MDVKHPLSQLQQHHFSLNTHKANAVAVTNDHLQSVKLKNVKNFKAILLARNDSSGRGYAFRRCHL